MKKLIVAAGLMAMSLSTMAQSKEYQVKNEERLINAVEWMQNSGEYRALCYQAFELGRIRLNRILKEDTSKKPKAIVLDIDETVLDNSPLEAYIIANGMNNFKKVWKEWVGRAEAEPLAGAVDFLNEAKEKGVTIFYITNRSEDEKRATVENLKRFNFPFADNEHIIMKHKSSDKEERRENVAEKYDIILLFGDDLNDFSDIFYYKDRSKRARDIVDENREKFGQKFILLPNAMYGDWNNELKRELKKSGRKSGLTPFK